MSEAESRGWKVPRRQTPELPRLQGSGGHRPQGEWNAEPLIRLVTCLEKFVFLSPLFCLSWTLLPRPCFPSECSGRSLRANT